MAKKKVTTKKTTNTVVNTIFGQYLKLVAEKTKLVIAICESMHIKEEFENMLIEATLSFKETHYADMIDLEIFSQDITSYNELARDTQIEIDLLISNVQNINLKMMNLL